MSVLSKGTLFDPVLVKDLVSKVKGKSSLAVLSTQEPISFNGNKEMVFTMDNEIDIVAENGKKGEGGITIDPVTTVPIKFEYGARISDEFMYASEEEQLSILEAFNDGFAKKVAKGLDIAAFHGLNPRTSTASTVIGSNNFDSKVTQTVTYNSEKVDENIESAIAVIEGADRDITGMVISSTCRQALAKMTVDKEGKGARLYPELAWGGNPGTLNGLPIDVNKTVSVISATATSKDEAIVGDFANAFKWGYAKEIPLEIIKYGDPDNSGKDLKGYNQIYIRAEVYLGWGILDVDSFARIVSTVTPTQTTPETPGQ